MEYTVQKLARLSGVSSRTLRYYDEIGILKPAKINSSGYRIYGPKEVDRLQQILFYRELDISLEDINKIVSEPSFDEVAALQEHRGKLLEKREQLDLLIDNVNKTIESKERCSIMRDKEKFEGFKMKFLKENEEKYGKEARQKYGEYAVNKSNQKIKNMTKDEYDEVSRLGAQVIETLESAFKTGNPAGELAQKTADLHRQWLCFYWEEYSEEAHAGLGQMYVDDERFAEYYDNGQRGKAEFLRDAILIYTGQSK